MRAVAAEQKSESMKAWLTRINFRQRHRTGHFYNFLTVGIILTCLFASLTIPAFAQSQPELPSYWQYSASSRVNHVLVADIDLDGVGDFITTDENGRVEMVDSIGAPQWRFVAPSSISSIAAINVLGPVDSPLEVLIGVPNNLILLSSAGEEIWRIRVAPLVEPPSLFPGGLLETAGEGLDKQNFLPAKLAPFDQNNDGRPEILVLLQSGHLLLYDAEGKLIWQETQYSSNPENIPTKLLVFDFDEDGQDEILFSVFNPRRFGQIVLINEGKVAWEIPVSGRITDLAQVQFQNGRPPLVAVGTSLGHLQLFDHFRRQRWLRTLNQPITSLAQFSTPAGNALAAATAVGTIVAYDQEGHRLWENNLAPNADRKILAISASAASVPPDQPSLAVTIESGDTSANAADLILLGSTGQIISKITNVDTLGLTRFVDSNQDQNNELLVGHFATLELLGLGVGNSENVREWEYTLDAVPSASLVYDFDGDGDEEAVIGTENGRIHSLSNDRTIRWLHDVGGAITNLAVLPRTAGNPAGIVVVRQGENAADSIPTAWIELREAKGERIWETELNSQVSALLVEYIDQTTDPEIIAGMDDGRIIIFTASGEKKSEFLLPELDGPVHSLSLMQNEDQSKNQIIVAGEHIIVGIDRQDNVKPVRIITSFEDSIIDVYAIGRDGTGELSTGLVVTTDGQRVHGLNWRGIEMAQWQWPKSLGGVPILSTSHKSADSFLPQRYSFLLGTETGQLIRLDVQDNQPLIPWQIDGIGKISALHWRDQDNDGSPDLAFAGTDDGQVWISQQSNLPQKNDTTAPLNLSSSVFALESIYRADSQTPDLLTLTGNGIVALFREQENRPPFLTKPVAVVDQDQYTISVEVNDVEQDNVSVQLEIQDSESDQWIAMDNQQALNGMGTLFWTTTTAHTSPNGLHFRFLFDDGSNRGTLVPPPGPLPIVTAPWENVVPEIVFGVGLITLTFVIIFIRQSQNPNAQASRFYRQLSRQPAQCLILLEQKYVHTHGSPDFLLHLANQARQANDQLIANLAHGLFLLDDRTQSGLSILVPTVEEIKNQKIETWEGLDRWQLTYSTCQSLFDAPSITEISLLRPQLLQLLKFKEIQDKKYHNLRLLKPVLTNMRDSERVDLVEDRLVYLNEAATQCKQIQEQLSEYPRSIEHTVVSSIIRRWTGLLSAEIEDLRGRAQLTVSLKTKRLVPTKHTIVALEIGNNGRSAAENVVVVLDNDPAYIVHSTPEEIPFLPSGRSREVRFTIEPQVIDRFRISFTITFDDRNQRGKVFAFGDMVHLLPPTRDFSPVPNPYTPGTPLRPDSMLFFGREDLFNFIAENAGYRSFRNVIILVGQRRTGKTSALLRLEDHLPDHLLPVYIDCQSLGVIAGMPALLEEFAWIIADALADRGINVEVPDLDQWQKDPTRLFQRRFLPKIKALLPPDTTLLLVFDEFEAFENLVADGILPSTFFTYLRHLMQHGEQLNFIFVGTRRLEEMSSDYWSVLFNIALYRKIDFLSTTAATRLITEPVASGLVYDDLAVDKILRVTAGHPYFLQLVCYTLVKQANSLRTGYVTISDVNAAVDEMLSFGEVHFAYLWQRSTATERALLTAVAHLMDQNQPFFPEELLDYLEPYYPQPDPVEVTRALNNLVERDVLREVTEEAKTLYELKLGLVGSWVAKNKSLSKLIAGNGSLKSELQLDEPANL
jgi:hypothetical protein